MQTIIWHNPRCSKSRAGLNYLEEQGVDHEIVRYLDASPSEAQVRDVLSKLGMAPRELMRTKETIYRELGLKEVTDDDALIAAMAKHPKLIERPIVIHGDKAVVARHAEKIAEIIPGF